MKFLISTYNKLLNLLKNTVGVVVERIAFLFSYFVGFGIGFVIFSFSKNGKFKKTPSRTNWVKSSQKENLSHMY